MPVKRTLPTLGLADKNFRYRTAAETDIRKTFERIARQRKQAERLAATNQQPLELEASTSTIVKLPARNRSAS